MATGDLTTLVNVKAWMTQDANVTFDDALLTRLITAASTFIQSYLNRNIALASYTEYRNGNDQYQMVLKNWPITGVASLSIDGLAILSAPPMVAQAPVSVGYVADTQEIYLRGYRFSRGQQNVQITYTAGYAVVPSDVEQACIELVTLRYRERGREGQSSKNIGNGQVVAFSIKDFAPSTLSALRQYKAGVPVW